jgi:ribose transport system substrate-binding protein
MKSVSPLQTLALAFTIIATAPGCGGDAGTSGGSASGKSYTIAMIAKSSTNPVFTAARKGADSAAAELSRQHGISIRIDWLTPPQEDGTVQAQRIAEAVNSGASAILVSASDAGKLVSAIDDAVSRGVPVMTFDSDVPASKRFSFYGGDDEAIGRQILAELAPLIGDKGKVAILAGNQNAPNLQARVRGVKDEATKHPSITIVNTFYHSETPQDAAAEVLRVKNAYPDIAGWAMVGGWPLFTTALMTDLDPNKVKIVAIDALPVQLPYIENGLAPVLLAQPVFSWGYESVKTIIDKIHLKKEVPPHVMMDLIRVSKDNLDDWRRQLAAWGFTQAARE